MNGPKQATNGSWALVPLGWPTGPGAPTPGLPHEESKVRSIREKHDSCVAPERKPTLGKTWENYISRGFPEVLENVVENHMENYKNS